MKTRLLFAAALALASFLSGCESDNLSARIQEKSATYATLQTWQKKHIEKGDVALTFTPDMVYMAVGTPSDKQTVGKSEVWIYRNYYPWPDANNVKYALSAEKNYGNQELVGGTQMIGVNGKLGSLATMRPFDPKNPPSISTTGGPQGGSMEPVDLPSYVLYVIFERGVVTKLRLVPN